MAPTDRDAPKTSAKTRAQQLSKTRPKRMRVPGPIPGFQDPYGLESPELDEDEDETIPTIELDQLSPAERLSAEGKQLEKTIKKILGRFEKAQDDHAAIRGLAECRAILELQARLAASLQEKSSVELLMQTPGFQDVRDALLEAIRPCAQCTERVTKAMDKIVKEM
jgi:hypothetical protein